MLFTYSTEQWISAAPLASHTLGGTRITFTGTGFDVTSQSYLARFATSRVVVSGNCTAISDVNVICEIPAFPGLSQTTSLRLLKGGMAIGQSGSPASFDFAPSWTVMKTDRTGTVLGGTTLTLVGSAFVTSTDRYQCVWTGVTRRAGALSSVAVEAEALSDKEVVCTSPAWPGVEDATVLSISKKDGLQRRVFFVGPAGGSFFEYYSVLEKVYTQSDDLRASPVVIAAAVGGSSVTIVGQGFKLDTTLSRTCRFTCVDAVCAGTFVESPAVPPFSSPSSADFKFITCVFPQWTHRIGSFRGIRSRVEIFRSDGIAYPGAPGFAPWIMVSRAMWNSGMSLSAYADGGTSITITGSNFCYAGSSCTNAYKCNFKLVEDPTKVAYSQQVRLAAAKIHMNPFLE